MRLYHVPRPGHIPLSAPRASALAIGAPILFCCVCHGCAYDIAGKGVAGPAPVAEALTLLGAVVAGVRA